MIEPHWSAAVTMAPAVGAWAASPTTASAAVIALAVSSCRTRCIVVPPLVGSDVTTLRGQRACGQSGLHPGLIDRVPHLRVARAGALRVRRVRATAPPAAAGPGARRPRPLEHRTTAVPGTVRGTVAASTRTAP